MIFTIGEKAIAEFVLDNSTPDDFAELLKNPEIDLVYLIELSPYSDSVENSVTGTPPLGTGAIAEFGFTTLGGIQNIFISNTGYTTEPSDSPANVSYLPVTENPFNIEKSVFSGDQFNGNAGSFGAIRILNGDASFDDLVDLFWDGRTVKVLAGAETFARDQFVTIFDGVASGIEYDEDEIVINIQSKDRILDVEFSQNLYEGTGDLEGGDDINGTPKPIAYGECRNVTPVLVDAANLVYQVHDGAMEAIDDVYDRGVALTDGGDVDDITTASPSAGQYLTQLSGGYFKLGSSPDGQITADIKGDNDGGYVNLSGEIISRILQTKLGSQSFGTAEIDQGALNALDDQVTGKIGLYIRQETTAKRIINDILTPLQCYWTFKRNGQFTAGVGIDPGESVLTITDNSIVDRELEALEVSTPAWRVILGYAKSWTVQNNTDLATATTDAQRTFVSEEYRKIITEQRNVRTKSPNAIEKKFNTLLATESDALTEASRIQNIFNKKRTTYRVRVVDLLFRVFIGDFVTLQTNRFNLNKNCIIIGINEDAETGITTLELWG